MITRIFYIDIENVGMREIKKAREVLKITDKVTVFINENQPAMYRDACFELSQTAAAVEVQTFTATTKNALDFHICASIGMLGTAKADIYIVSKDKGYAGAMEIFTKNGINVTRIESLDELNRETSQYEQMKAKVKIALEGIGVLKGTKKQIKICTKLMLENREKGTFHNALQQAFKDIPNTKLLYKQLLPIYKEYMLNNHA